MIILKYKFPQIAFSKIKNNTRILNKYIKNSDIISMNTIKKLVFISLMFACIGLMHAQNKLDQYFDHLFESNKFMGSVSISFKDSIIYSRAEGYADVDTKKKNDRNTKIRIGSISKSFTAALVLKAVEEGKIKLSDSLANWFPELKNAQKITIDLMLRHRTGIFNFTEIPDSREWEQKFHTQEEFITYFKNQQSNFEPGTEFEYSNTNYALLSFILEKIYQKNFADILREKITEPLRLNNTDYTFETDSTKNEAYSYNIQNKYIRNQNVNYTNHPASGGILSTADDLNRFLIALFDGKIINKESLKIMLPLNHGEYGMGIIKLQSTKQDIFEHGGRVENYFSDYWYFPNEKLGLVILSNSTNINLDDPLLKMTQYAYGNTVETPDFESIDAIQKDDFKKLIRYIESSSITVHTRLLQHLSVVLKFITNLAFCEVCYKFKYTIQSCVSEGERVLFDL